MIILNFTTIAGRDRVRVRQTVRAARQHALTLGLEEVNKVESNDPDKPRTMECSVCQRDCRTLPLKLKMAGFSALGLARAVRRRYSGCADFRRRFRLRIALSLSDGEADGISTPGAKRNMRIW